MDNHETDSRLKGDEHLRERTVDGLRAIAETIQKASDVLAAAEPGSIAALIDQAAANLENLSTRLQDRTGEETSQDVLRRVAQESPAAVIAGNVLASFALGAAAGTFFSSADAGHPAAPGTAEVPIQTAQTGAGGLGYLEKQEASE